jgi:DNA-binding transcriptional ArsR family regulator
MPSAAVLPVETVFRALGDPVRLAIVENLVQAARGHATVNELAERFPISLQAVSKHIKVLESAGVVSQSRDGRHRPVRLVASGIVPASDWLDHRIRQIEARYSRLDHLLANLQEENPS